MRKHFGDRLKELRIEIKLTQEQLAEKFNTGKASISHYESNRRIPDAHTIEKFAEYFNVTVDFLLGRTEIRQQAEPKYIYSSDELIELLPVEYKELFKSQNLGYVKFTKKMIKEQINPETLIKLLEHHLQIKEDFKKDKEKNNT